MKWYEDNKPVTKTFATGKTLGDTGADLDRMFLISSAITKAFHGDHGQYDRYQTLHPERNAEDMVISLSPAEHKLFVEALIEHREKMLHQVDGTEQLLRRIVGNITQYMDVVGERPLHISDYDRASLAIRDGDLNAFKDLYPRVLNRVGDLLVETAGRCGDVGRKMGLIQKGSRPGEYAQRILQPLTYENRNSWQAEEYLKAGMKIEPNDYDSLYTCIRNGALTCGHLILDQGMDFGQFLSWTERHGVYDNYLEAMEELEAHWAEQHPAQEQGIGDMGGIS